MSNPIKMSGFGWKFRLRLKDRLSGFCVTLACPQVQCMGTTQETGVANARTQILGKFVTGKWTITRQEFSGYMGQYDWRDASSISASTDDVVDLLLERAPGTARTFSALGKICARPLFAALYKDAGIENV